MLRRSTSSTPTGGPTGSRTRSPWNTSATRLPRHLSSPTRGSSCSGRVRPSPRRPQVASRRRQPAHSSHDWPRLSRPVRMRSVRSRLGAVRAGSCVRRPGGLHRAWIRSRSSRQTSRTGPSQRMQIADAQSASTGEGVTVAVIDSGVAVTNPWLPDVTSKQIAGNAEAQDLPTLVAGLIGGRSGPGRDEPLGIAPGVRIVSVKVYDGADAGEDGQALTPDNIARGIDAAVDEGAQVIDVSPASLTGSDALRASVARAIRSGVVVIAAIGERPLDGQPGFDQYGTYTEGENVQTFPAAYPGVLGVGLGTADGRLQQRGPTCRATPSTSSLRSPKRSARRTNGSTCVVESRHHRVCRRRGQRARGAAGCAAARTTTRPRSRP